MSKLSEFFEKQYSCILHFRYSPSAGIRNTGSHFIAIIKANDNAYYCFNNLDSRGCFYHDGLLSIHIAIYVLKL